MKRIALVALLSLTAVACSSTKAAKTSDGVTLSMELSVNRPGADIANFELKEANVALCKTSCAENLQCAAYTYAGPGVISPAARCILKNSVTEPFTAEGYVSGVKSTVAPKAE